MGSDSTPRGSGNVFSVITTLTTSDKALVKQATGWDIDADPLGLHASQDATELAGRLNIDRYSGALTGPVTQSYLEGLVKNSAGAAQLPADLLI